MPKFSKRSLGYLANAHPDLQRVAHEAIKHFDFTVICAFRGERAQNDAYRAGKSRARFGQSPHNFSPSLAIDIVPFPLDWNDLAAFDRMGAAFLNAARECGVKVKWGKDFIGLIDYPHFELHDWRQYAKG